MRRLLLDMHVLIWWLADDPALGAETKALIVDSRNEVIVSVATIWEMSIKRAKGLLRVPADLESLIADEGFSALPISLFHAQQAGALPELHRDPFDRNAGRASAGRGSGADHRRHHDSAIRRPLPVRSRIIASLSLPRP